MDSRRHYGYHPSRRITRIKNAQTGVFYLFIRTEYLYMFQLVLPMSGNIYFQTMDDASWNIVEREYICDNSAYPIQMLRLSLLCNSTDSPALYQPIHAKRHRHHCHLRCPNLRWHSVRYLQHHQQQPLSQQQTHHP